MKDVATPVGWKIAQLSELCESDAPIMYGILQPGPEVEGGVPYVRPTEIDDDRIRLEEIKRTSPEIAAQYRRATLRTGDLLITIVGTLGKIAVVPAELDGANITQSSARIRLNGKVADTRYIRQILRSPVAVRQYDDCRLGTGVPRLNIHHVRDLKIPLPPLTEQSRIAEVLDRAEALRAKRRAALAQLDFLTQSLFLDLFGDPAKNERGWPAQAMGSLMKIRRGGSPRPIENYLGGDINWIKIGDGTKGSDIYLEKCADKITKEGLSKTVFLRAGSLIFANCGVSLGFARILKVDGCIHDGWLSLEDIPEGKVNKLFLLKALNTITDHFRRIAPSGTQPNLNTALMKSFRLILPPLELQREFASQVAAVEKLKTAHRASLAELNALLASLQYRAFRGEL